MGEREGGEVKVLFNREKMECRCGGERGKELWMFEML